MAKVVTFGEVMLRLAPNGYYRFFQNDQMQATFGGGEANVAVSLANFGLDSTYVTKLPEHAIGQAAVDSLRYFGVDTSKIVRGGERVGIYFLEKGASQRGSVCIYDRKYSAIQQAKKEDFDWAVETAQQKKGMDCSKVEFLTLDEGLCVQIMHIGSYDNEPISVALMDAYIEQEGYENDLSDVRLHHEIYLSDARKVEPARRKTVIRHPIKKMG